MHGTLRGMLTLTIGLACLAFAAEARAIALVPSSVDVAVLPGESATAEATLANDDGAPHDYTVELLTVNFDSENHEPNFTTLSSAYYGWFSLPTTTLSLAPGEHRALTLEVSPPASAKAQTVVVALLVQEQTSGEGVQILPGISTLVFVTVGDVARHLTLTDFSPADQFVSHLPVSFHFTLQNDGAAVAAPAGYMVIRNMFGTVDAVLPLNAGNLHVFPGSEREFSVVWDNTAILPRLGVFTVTIAPAVGSEAVTPEFSTTLWFFPWQFFLLPLVALTLIVTLLMLRRRRHV